MKNCVKVFILVAVFLPVLLYGMDTVYVHSDVAPNEGSLNSAIKSVIDSKVRLDTKVFKLDPAGYYILSGFISVPSQQHLTIVADPPGVKAPPQIFLSSLINWGGSYMIDCYGDLTMKNIWLTYAEVNGVQHGTPIEFDDDTVRHRNTGEFEGCIFDYGPIPGAIEVRSQHFSSTLKNCYWRNNVDSHYRYYGRAISFPFSTTAWHEDTIAFENCTFSNIGYGFMGYQPGEATPETADFVTFNHCTFFNCMMHSIEPSFWQWGSVTNSIFVNIWMFGDVLANREVNWLLGGMLNVDSLSLSANAIFPLVNTERNRHVLLANNNYFIEQWLKDFMDHGTPDIIALDDTRRPHPMPMLSPHTLVFFDSVSATGKVWPYINRSHLYDNTDPGFTSAPTNVDGVKAFLLGRWINGSNVDWSYNPQDDINGLWPFNEDLGYSNATLKSAGMGGFPLGDLYHWFPKQYTSWKAQAAAEQSRIMKWLTTGSDPGTSSVEMVPGVPTDFALTQNYPNPFNPVTRIDYSIPEKNHVTLKVYNLVGQEVATLFDGIQPVGKYTVSFDGKSLASGVYFYRLQAGEFSVTKKLILMK
jgi:hypothetical protein